MQRRVGDERRLGTDTFRSGLARQGQVMGVSQRRAQTIRKPGAASTSARQALLVTPEPLYTSVDKFTLYDKAYKSPIYATPNIYNLCA